jgi:putative PLP-dependent aminotransferase (TIGR04422 family)
MSKDSIWYRQPNKLFLPRFASYQDVENFLQTNFTGGYPVLVSSGRSAISLVIRLFWHQPTISLFKFASQCVVNACLINQIIPTTYLGSKEDVVYNQWGYVASNVNSGNFIEDSCDYFKPLGSKVRRLNSRFEIWSITKILGTGAGGVIWCKYENDARKLRLERSKLNRLNPKIILKALRPIFPHFYRYWEFLELKNPTLNKLQIGAIYKSMLSWSTEWDRRGAQVRHLIQELQKLGYSGKIMEEDNILMGNLIPTVIVIDSGQNIPQHPGIQAHVINRYLKPRKVNIIPYLGKKYTQKIGR